MRKVCSEEVVRDSKASSTEPGLVPKSVRLSKSVFLVPKLADAKVAFCQEISPKYCCCVNPVLSSDSLHHFHL